MNRGGVVVDTMERLIALFSGHCSERSTLEELAQMAGAPSRWPRAHDLFQRIRRKTLAVERSPNAALETQYLFEESCAKALYNFSGGPALFDSDSPYWIVPNALALARRLGISDSEVIRIVAP